MMRRLPPLRAHGWIVPLLLVAVVALAIPAAAGPGERLDEIEDSREKIQHKLEQKAERAQDVSAEVVRLDRLRVRAEARVRELDDRLDRIDADIADVRARLERAQVRLAVLHGELLDIQRRLVHRTNLFTERAVATYMAGPTAVADSLLSSNTFGELFDRYAYYESALESDSELVEEISALRDETEAHRQLVENRELEIARAKARLEKNRARVADIRSERAGVLAQRKAAVSEKRDLLAGLRADQARLRAVDAQLEKDSDRIRALLAPSVPAQGPTGDGQLLWPANGPVTSGYGYRIHPIFGDRRFHSGIDIGAPYGAPVFAADRGRVVFVGAMSGYGNVIVVDHGGNLATTYNHLSGFYVSSGDSVSRGKTIGAVGCTGYCTGPHLHFEVRVGGSPVDPMPYLQ